MAFPIKKSSTCKKSVSKLDEGKLNQMIRERAYHIWESKGKPQGQDANCWLQAEKEILSKTKK